MKLTSITEACLIAQKRSQKMKIVSPPSASAATSANRRPGKVHRAPSFGLFQSFSATASVACNNILISFSGFYCLIANRPAPVQGTGFPAAVTSRPTIILPVTVPHPCRDRASAAAFHKVLSASAAPVTPELYGNERPQRTKIRFFANNVAFCLRFVSNLYCPAAPRHTPARTTGR